MSASDRELKAAVEAVRIAAKVCRSVQSQITPDVLDKQDKSPVTVADYASQAVVCRALARAFPDDPVVGEEDAAALRGADQAVFLQRVAEELSRVDISGANAEICDWIDRGGCSDYCDRFWTLDPIDGTKGFLRSEQYAISLALIVNGRIELGVLGCPNLPHDAVPSGEAGLLFTAVRGQGARCLSLNPERHAEREIRVSSTQETRLARFCESVESGHSSHDEAAQVAKRLGITTEPVRMDSQAKYAEVARGSADIYLRLPTRQDYFEKIWDHAGGVLVVEEAGGRVTDIAGKPLDFTRGRELRENRGVIVTNGALHDAVLDALHAVGVR